MQLASPLVIDGNFLEWLERVVLAQWVTEELGHPPASEEDIQFCLKRMNELRKERHAN